MIDPELAMLDMDDNAAREVKRALKTLHVTGLFRIMISQTKRSLIDSFEDEPAKLAAEIIEAQRENRLLLTLEQYAEALD